MTPVQREYARLCGQRAGYEVRAYEAIADGRQESARTALRMATMFAEMAGLYRVEAARDDERDAANAAEVTP